MRKLRFLIAGASRFSCLRQQWSRLSRRQAETPKAGCRKPEAGGVRRRTPTILFRNSTRRRLIQCLTGQSDLCDRCKTFLNPMQAACGRKLRHFDTIRRGHSLAPRRHLIVSRPRLEALISDAQIISAAAAVPAAWLQRAELSARLQSALAAASAG